jgi:tetratricopeptide (TPR) repeat protein
MAKTWMSAAGQNGIPSAFVVGRDGKIAWIGNPIHPKGEFDQVVAQVVAGTYDSRPAAEAMAKQQEEARKFQELMKPYRDAVKANNPQQAVSELDKLFAAKPEMEQPLGLSKFNAMLKYNEASAYAYGRKLVAGVYKDNPGALNSLAWTIAENKNDVLKQPDYALAIAMAERASELLKHEEPLILDTLAYAYFRSGNKKKAIEIQEKAIAIGEKAGANFDAATLTEMRGRLETFKKG